MEKHYHYWGIKTPLFSDTQGLPLLSSSRETLANKLVLLSLERSDLNLVCAPFGLGKSTLAKTLYHRLPTLKQEALLINLLDPPGAGDWIFERIARFFKPNGSWTRGQVLTNLDELLKNNRKLTIIVDNGHYLESEQELAQISKFLALKSSVGNFVNFTIFGQPSLLAAINKSPSSKNLVSLVANLEPIGFEEFSDFVTRAFKLSGAPRDPVTPPAKKIIFDHTQGLVVKAQALLENCLIEGQMVGKTLVDDVLANSCVQQTLPRQGARHPEPSRHPERSEGTRDASPPAQHDAKSDQHDAKSAQQEAKPKKPAMDLRSLFFEEEDDES
jgi:hypothetical protein